MLKTVLEQLLENVREENESELRLLKRLEGNIVESKKRLDNNKTLIDELEQYLGIGDYEKS